MDPPQKATQKPSGDDRLVPITQSPGWNSLQTLTACVSGRLGRYSRGGKPHSRPKTRGNRAILIEMDLDTIFRAHHPASDLTQEALDEVDKAARDLLRSLSAMANLQLPISERLSTGLVQRPETSQREDDYITSLRASVDDVSKLGSEFARLHKLMQFLLSPAVIAEKRCFSLGTGLYPLFIVPEGVVGELAIGHLTIWRRILETLPDTSQTLESDSFVSPEPTSKSSRGGVFDERLGERVRSVVGNIFKEFRKLSCVKKTTHEIRLNVSDELYTACPGEEHNLDMFISCCPGTYPMWQNAQCGDFPVKDAVKQRICHSISRAREDRTKLHILVDSEGLYDVTDRLPAVRLHRDDFDGPSLSELLEQNIFRPIDFKAYEDKTAERKFNSGTKAQVALGLSRCLMDFFDKGFELASHSWLAENVHFREAFANTKEGKKQLLYVSLRPNLDQNATSDMVKMFNNGSPVVLSFAKLLLEVLYGEALKVQVKPNEKDNLLSWLELGKIVQALRDDPDGGPFTSKYLEVVDNCLSLWATLSDGVDRTDLSHTIRFIRKAIYQKIVYELELIASSERSRRTGSDVVASRERRKRKTQDPLLNEVPAKKLAHMPRNPSASMPLGLVNGQSSRVSLGGSVTTATEEDDGDAGPHGRLSLYDEQGRTNEREQKAAEEHLSELINSMGMYINTYANSTPNEKKPIKVAVIDSGVNSDEAWIRARSSQIGDKRNWTSDEINDCADTCGHGTHITRLILKVAPAAKVYIAKVSKRKKFDPKVAEQVAQAIEWAVGVWEVDIISLSMAVDGEDPTIKKALDRILRPPHGSPKKVVVMAAASNWGGNRHIAFPASCRGVICVHSTDGHGNPSKTNPTAQKGKDFAVLGMSIKSSVKTKDKKRTEVYISGTSYATAIGVGIAANVLEVAKGDPTLWDEGKGKLCSSWGMSCVFRIMSEERAGYRNVMPWRLFDGRPEEDVYRDIKNALEPDV